MVPATVPVWIAWMFETVRLFFGTEKVKLRPPAGTNWIIGSLTKPALGVNERPRVTEVSKVAVPPKSKLIFA